MSAITISELIPVDELRLVSLPVQKHTTGGEWSNPSKGQYILVDKNGNRFEYVINNEVDTSNRVDLANFSINAPMIVGTSSLPAVENHYWGEI